MGRVTFTDNSGQLGWFDPNAATAQLTEGTRWNGQDRVGICSGLQTSRAVLWRTASGRWIVNTDGTNEHGGADQWEWLSDDQAHGWLMRSAGSPGDRGTEAGEALGRWFPDVPGESTPGRPAVGPAISVSYPAELLTRIDDAAKTSGMSRAAWLRAAAEDGLA